MPADAIQDPDVLILWSHPQYAPRAGRALYQHNLEFPDSYLEEVIIFLNEEI